MSGPSPSSAQCSVLTGKLLAVDGFTTRSVMLGKVTALKHELGDDTVEARALVSKSMLASGELTEVLGSFGYNVVVELEDDTALVFAVDADVELSIRWSDHGNQAKEKEKAVQKDGEMNIRIRLTW